MRTITITRTVCSFDELNDKAKERALNKVIESFGYDARDFTSDDYEGTLKEIEKVFHIKVQSWEVDSEYRYHYTFDFTNYRWDSWDCDYEDEPRMLTRFLNNEVFPWIKGRYFSKSYKDEDGKWVSKKRYSKVLPDRDGCYLTGVCTDYAFDKAIDNAFEYVRRGYTIRQFVNEVLDEFFSSWGKDLDYLLSEEYAKDQIDEREIEFYGNGDIYGTAW